jgi:DHA2 family multidrug resistance protein
MSVADVYLTLMALAMSLIVLLLLLPHRAYPPGTEPPSIK